jgi:3-oxoacyl-[acyl-carrier protein] reductase
VDARERTLAGEGPWEERARLERANSRERSREGKIAVVTGAGRGIGRAIARAVAGAGGTVVLVARTAAEVDAVAAEILSRGGRAVAIPADVTSEDGVVRLFERVRDELGRLDLLVNNAGVGLFGPVSEIRAEDIDRILAVNVRGAFLCSREALRLMRPRKEGTIINIASVVGFRGYPNQSAYSASKHALMGLTKSLAVEAQPDGIRVSAVLPGGVDTELIRRARPDIPTADMLAPEDVAGAVMYLLSLSERAAVDEIYIRRRASIPW